MMAIEIYSVIMVICEQLISLIFFNSAFERKFSFKKTVLIDLLCGIILALVYPIRIPNLNLIMFLVVNYCFVNISYYCKKTLSLMYVFILTALMMISEFIFMVIFHNVFGIEVEFLTQGENIILFMFLSKSLYLLIVLFVKRFIAKHKALQKYDITFYFFLSVPLATIILLSGMYFVIYKLSYKESAIIILSILPLIISEFVCYIVYDYIIDKNDKIEMLKERTFKNELINKEFALYKQRYESSRIIMHDIKKHLSIIKELGVGTDKANNYIDEYLAKNDETVFFTNNNVLNIILNEKKQLCDNNHILLFVNINTNKINTLLDRDIVTIFCNLLDNAIESCRVSAEKIITIDIYAVNEVFLTINISNSCDLPPVIVDKRLMTSKKIRILTA